MRREANPGTKITKKTTDAIPVVSINSVILYNKGDDHKERGANGSNFLKSCLLPIRFKNPAFRRGGMVAGTHGLALLLLCLWLLTGLRLALLLLRLVLELRLLAHVEMEI